MNPEDPADSADDQTQTRPLAQPSEDPEEKAWREDPTNAKFTRHLRRENASYRIRARNAEQQLAALDPDGSGRVSLSAVQVENRKLKLDNGLLQVSHQLGVGNVRLLKAYMADSLTDLDPSEPNFLEDLQTKIEEAIESEPSLRGGRPGGGSAAPYTAGARFGGPPSPPDQITDRAVLRGMTPEEVEAAKSAGLLNRMLGRS